MTKSNVGRKFIIDYDLVKDLASVACTQKEIASILGCNVRTLQRDEKFKEVYTQGLDNANVSLRRAQFKTAVENGNVTMLIWLGKQMLGQKEPEKDDTEVLDKLDKLLKAQDET